MKPMGREPLPLTAEQRAIAEEYLNSNLGYKELAKKHGKPESTVIYWVKKLRKERGESK